jgi:hypothetical protein
VCFSRKTVRKRVFMANFRQFSCQILALSYVLLQVDDMTNISVGDAVLAI